MVAPSTYQPTRPSPHEPRSLRWGALTLGLVFVAACGDSGATGAGGGAATGGGTSAGAGTSQGGGGEAACAAGTCFVAPEGWSGPVRLVTSTAGGSTPPCPAALPDSAFEGFAGALDAPPNTCGCSCEAPTGGSCSTGSAKTVFLQGFTGDTCNGGACSGADTLEAGTCIPVIQGSCSLSKQVTTSAPEILGASCVPTASGGTSSVSWELTANVCGSAALPACGAGTCVPDGAVCVWQAGDLACPAELPTKTLVHDGVDDTRGCSECTCGAVINRTCEGTVTAHTNGACQTAIASSPIPGCMDWLPAAGTTFIKFNLEPTGGSCLPQGGTPTGDAIPSGTTTVCCTP